MSASTPTRAWSTTRSPFANPKAPVITTDLTTTAVTGTELRSWLTPQTKAPCPTSGTKVSGGSDSVVASNSAAYTASGW
ncbi:MAG: hypothetical protein ACLRWQ_20515 [Flavonifractor plautii]